MLTVVRYAALAMYDALYRWRLAELLFGCDLTDIYGGEASGAEEISSFTGSPREHSRSKLGEGPERRRSTFGAESEIRRGIVGALTEHRGAKSEYGRSTIGAPRCFQCSLLSLGLNVQS